jgi:hypothetical protein
VGNTTSRLDISRRFIDFFSEWELPSYKRNENIAKEAEESIKKDIPVKCRAVPLESGMSFNFLPELPADSD